MKVLCYVSFENSINNRQRFVSHVCMNIFKIINSNNKEKQKNSNNYDLPGRHALLIEIV